MPTPTLARSAIAPLVLAGLMVLSSAGSVAAGKGDKRDKGGARDKDPQGQAQEDQAQEGQGQGSGSVVIATIPGGRYKMARTKVASDVTRIVDAAGDQRTLDGSPASGAEPWTDIAAATVAPVKVPGKLVTRMFEDFPRGARGSYYGSDADWSKGDKAVFVAVELAAERPGGVVQQVEVGLDGDRAGPSQAGGAADSRAGLERFSLSGTFSDGSESSGTTDVSGRLPGGAIEFYNASSGVFGFYEAKSQTYFLIMPLTSDATSVTVALRSVTADGEVIDRLALPGGGHFISLDDATGGWDAQAGSPPLACRSLEALPVPAEAAAGTATEPGVSRIRYAAGADPALDVAESRALLGALDDAGETITLSLTPVVAAEGSDDDPDAGANGGTSRLTVDAAVSRAPGLGAFTLTFDVPPGTWQVDVVDGEALVTPAGEALVDTSSLVGSGGLRTGEGLLGLVAGDPACARFVLGDDVCTFVPADAMAGLAGLAGSEVEQKAVQRPDGAAWCVGTASATGEVQYIARFGTSYLTTDAFAAEVAAGECQSVPVDRGAEAAILDCGASGFERHLIRVLPDAIADRDPDGGLLVSIDLLVDSSQPVGQRYDAAAADALLGELVEGVARAATVGGE
jgi:hypothetical protein